MHTTKKRVGDAQRELMPRQNALKELARCQLLSPVSEKRCNLCHPLFHVEMSETCATIEHRPVNDFSFGMSVVSALGNDDLHGFALNPITLSISEGRA